MSIPETNDTTEEREVPSPDPQNGIAQALLKADPETPMKQVLKDVKRWICTGCGREKLNKPTHCKQCGATTFDRVVPSGGDDDGS